MITNLIITIVFLAVQGILAHLPDIVSGSPFVTSVITAGGYLHPLNLILPVDVCVGISAFDISFELSYLLFKIIYWIIRRFPTQS